MSALGRVVYLAPARWAYVDLGRQLGARRPPAPRGDLPEGPGAARPSWTGSSRRLPLRPRPQAPSAGPSPASPTASRRRRVRALRFPRTATWLAAGASAPGQLDAVAERAQPAGDQVAVVALDL